MLSAGPASRTIVEHGVDGCGSCSLGTPSFLLNDKWSHLLVIQFSTLVVVASRSDITAIGRPKVVLSAHDIMPSGGVSHQMYPPSIPLDPNRCSSCWTLLNIRKLPSAELKSVAFVVEHAASTWYILSAVRWDYLARARRPYPPHIYTYTCTRGKKLFHR